LAIAHLASLTKTSSSRALWLTVLSPLFLLSFVSTGHNDAIMIALVLAAVIAMLADRYLMAIALTGFSAACKLPALAATVVFGVVEFHSVRSRRWLRLALSVLITAGVIALTTALAGNGWGWASPSALKIPTELRTLITPSVCLGYFVASVLHLLQLQVPTHIIISLTQDIFELGIIAATLILTWRATRETFIAHLGMILLLLAILGPVIWPWYLTWGIALLAVTKLQHLRILAVLGGLAMFSVTANGTPILYGRSFLVTGPLVIIGLVWFLRSPTWLAMVRGDA
jgi:alpha-1,6-mannosyltransferase